MAEPEDEPPPILLPCSICSRTFKPESLQKHLKVCEKQATKKRKIFDSSKQRIQGTELAEFLPKILKEKKNEKVIVKKPESNWKERHLEFVAAIRAARGVEPPAKSSTAVSKSLNEKCPHCDRNFGPKAFDRHIEWCKEQKARIPKSPASLIQAKERLEARTKYRAPPLAKSKRTLTREKYSRVSQSPSKDPSPLGSQSAVAFSKPQIPEVKVQDTTSRIQVSSGTRNRPKLSSSSPSCTLPGGNILMKRRDPSPSPSKRPFRSESRTPRRGTVLTKNEEVNNNANLICSSNTISKLKPPEDRRRGKEVKPKTIDNSSSAEEVYDPYVSAERQMMELCSHGDFIQHSHQQNRNSLPTHSESPAFASFASTHRSAFVRYSPTNVSHLVNDNAIPSSLLAEFEDLFLAEHQKSKDNINENIVVDLSDIRFNVSNNNLLTGQTMKKQSKIRAKMESAALSLQQSVSLRNYENEMKVGTEASNLVQDNCDDNPLPNLSLFSPLFFSSPEPHVQSKSYFEKGDADKRTTEDNCILKSESSVICELDSHIKSHSAGGKFSADSAYGSLNRQSPNHSSQICGKTDETEGDRLCFMSSSSSESSLPPLSSVQVKVAKREVSNPTRSPPSPCAVDANPVMQSVPRMSKFCHECGSKYPVTVAKFCCQCGVRRLAM